MLIKRKDMEDILIFFQFMRNHVKNQRSEFLQYEKKLDSHMDRMEKILASFMETVRRDMDRFERKLEKYERVEVVLNCKNSK